MQVIGWLQLRKRALTPNLSSEPVHEKIGCLSTKEVQIEYGKEYGIDLAQEESLWLLKGPPVAAVV